MKKDADEGFFSIEMNSKRHVKNISISDESHNRVLFEGYLGNLAKLGMIEDAILEITGTNGVFRIDLTERQLQKILNQKEAV